MLATHKISTKWPFDKTKLSLFLPDKGEEYLPRVLLLSLKEGWQTWEI